MEQHKLDYHLVKVSFFFFCLIILLSAFFHISEWQVKAQVSSGWFFPDLNYRMEFNITGSSSGNVSDYQLNFTVYNDAFINGSGYPITRSDLFTYNGSIVQEHDLVNDTTNRIRIMDPPAPDTDWSAVGAGVIYEKDGVFYITLRRRAPAPSRGYCYELWNSTDLSNWNLMWNVTKTQLSSSADSVEGSSLWFFNNSWYFFFCVDDPDFRSWYVKNETLMGLKWNLLNNATWTDVAIGSNYYDKDTRLYFFNNTFYLICELKTWVGATRSTILFRGTSSLDDNLWTQIVNFTKIYDDGTGLGDQDKDGVIFYDGTSRKWIYWGTGRAALDVDFEWWAVSDDLETEASWQYVSKRNTNPKQIFYPYYYSVSDDRTIVYSMIMYDNGSAPLYIWDYRSDPIGSEHISYAYKNKVHLEPAHVQTDFDDVRFTWYNYSTSQEEEISYWIEEVILNDHAIFWVEVPSINNLTDNTVYLYYGNPTLTTTSNGDATFLLYDHFEGTNLTLLKWTGQIANFVVNNSMLYTTNSSSFLWSQANWSDYAVESRMRFTGGARGAIGLRGNDQAQYSVNGGKGYYARVRDPNDLWELIVHDGVSAEVKLGSYSLDVDQDWHRINIKAYDANIEANLWNSTFNKKFSVIDETLTNGRVRLVSFLLEVDGVDKVEWDFVAVRNFILPEPQIAISGNEEVQPTIEFEVSFDESIHPSYSSSSARGYSVMFSQNINPNYDFAEEWELHFDLTETLLHLSQMQIAVETLIGIFQTTLTEMISPDETFLIQKEISEVEVENFQILFPSGSSFGLQSAVDKSVILNVVEGTLNSTDYTLKITRGGGYFRFSAKEDVKIRITYTVDNVKVSGDQGKSLRTIRSGSVITVDPKDNVLIQWDIALTPLFPLMAIIGIVGLSALFIGPSYGVWKMRKGHYYDGFVNGLIITVIGIALFMAWLW